MVTCFLDNNVILISPSLADTVLCFSLIYGDYLTDLSLKPISLQTYTLLFMIVVVLRPR